jgi:hypothetical protein
VCDHRPPVGLGRQGGPLVAVPLDLLVPAGTRGYCYCSSQHPTGPMLCNGFPAGANCVRLPPPYEAGEEERPRHTRGPFLGPPWRAVNSPDY